MDNLKSRLYIAVKRRKSEVFLRADFESFGGYDQVGRALKGLVDDGVLLKIGFGLYAKATVSPLSGDHPVPRIGIRRLGEEALRRLDVAASPSAAERDYDAGKTTQVPSGRLLAVDRRVRRKIGYNGLYLEFERASRG